MLSNAELDRLIAELRTHPLAEGKLREIKEGIYVSLSQSQPEGLENDFCLNAGGRMYFLFRKAAAIYPAGRKTHQWASYSAANNSFSGKEGK
jgi:hypothetical protein